MSIKILGGYNYNPNNKINPNKYIHKNIVGNNTYYQVIKSGVSNGERYTWYYGNFSSLREARECRDYWEKLGFPEPPKKKKDPMRNITKRWEHSYRISKSINGEKIATAPISRKLPISIINISNAIIILSFLAKIYPSLFIIFIKPCHLTNVI